MHSLALALLAGAAVAAEPDKPLPGDEMIAKYLKRLTQEQSAKFLDGATTRAEWEQKLPRLRQEYLDMLGLWPLPEKTPLKATITGTLEHAGVVIAKLHFQSRPGLYVTGNLYRPKGSLEPERPEKLPAILYVCGHANKGRDGNKTAYQEHGLRFAYNGYVCLTIDSLQLGEVTGKHHGTYNLGRWWWQSAGYTPAGVECWNGIRAIDYLISRPDVDPQRIGVTGISGGGAATTWISAADERVKVSVPVSGMSDLESYVSNKVINGHCDCMFMVNMYGWEWTTILALIAPRPLLFANSDADPIFPMDGNRRVIERLRRVYKMYDKPELVDDHVSKGGHAYRPDLRMAVYRWMNKHLKNDTGEVKDVNFTLLPGKDLRVFPEDRDLPKDQVNDRIDETFVPRADVKLPEEGKFEEWKAGLMKQLRERPFRAFPERIPAAKFAKKSDGRDAIDLETEPGIRTMRVGEGGALFLLSTETEKARRELTDEQLEEIKPFDRKGTHGYAVRGTKADVWTRRSPPNYVERAHALLGRTIDQGRVWDIAAYLRYVNEKAPKTIVALGDAGILLAYAALFEPTDAEMILVFPPTSHKDGPHFLGVLRVLDVPDAVGMLAPRKLTIIGGKDKAFDRTAEIYRRAGAEKQFIRK